MAVTVMMTSVKYLKKILIIEHLIDRCVKLLSGNVEVNFDFHLLFVIIVKIYFNFNCCFTVHFDKYKAFFTNKFTFY